MGVLSPKVGLLYAYLVSIIFAMGLIVVPFDFMAQYKLDFSDMALSEKVIIVSCVQSQGVFLTMSASVLRIVKDHGSDATKSMVCLLSGIGWAVTIAWSIYTFPKWHELGVPYAGIYFNCVLFGLGSLFLLLGAGAPQVKIAPLGKSIYWGILGLIALWAVYVYFMVTQPEALIKAYGVDLEGKAKKFLDLFMQSVMSTGMGNAIMIWIALVLSPTAAVTYMVARFYSCVSLGMFWVCATLAAVWKAMDTDGEYDTLLAGMRFNCFLWFVFMALFYGPMVGMDSSIVDAVEQKLCSAREMDVADGAYVTMRPE